MAYRRRSTSRNRGSRKRVQSKRYAPRSRYSGGKSVHAPKRQRVRRRNSGRSGRGVLQTLRIELAPGLTSSLGGGGIQRPRPTRRTKHF